LIRADAELNASGFISGMKQMGSSASATSGNMTGLVAAFGAFAPVLASITMLVGGLKRALDLGGELSDMQSNTGQAISDLVVLRQAFENAGVGGSALESILVKFQAKLAGMEDETGAAANALNQLGLRAEDLKGMTAIQQLEAMQAGFAGVADQGQRAAITTNLFGKGGIKMGALLDDPQAMNTAREQAGAMGGVLERMAPLFDSISDSVGAISLKFEQFGVGAMEFVAPALAQLAEGVSAIDFTPLGNIVGIVFAGFLKLLAVLQPVYEYMKKIAALAGVDLSMHHGGVGGTKAFGEFLGLSTDGGPRKGRLGLMSGFGEMISSSPVASSLGRVGLGGGVAGDSVLGRIDKTNSLLEQVRDALRAGSRISTSLEPQPFPSV
jgi:hypothetical protein